MKLFELKGSEIKDVESIRDVIEDALGVNVQNIGEGAFGAVYATPDDPGTVMKVSHGTTVEDIENNKDGYLNYINTIAKHSKASGNPYLPKIYSIKFYLDDAERYHFRRLKYVVEMERLEPIVSGKSGKEVYGDQDDEHSFFNQVAVMADKMFKNFDSKDYHDVLDIMYAIVDFIKGYTAGLVIEDRRFKEALVIIRKAIRENNTRRLDIKVDNLMFRRTPYGLQLVITDPIA